MKLYMGGETDRKRREQTVCWQLFCPPGLTAHLIVPLSPQSEFVLSFREFIVGVTLPDDWGFLQHGLSPHDHWRKYKVCMYPSLQGPCLPQPPSAGMCGAEYRGKSGVTEIPGEDFLGYRLFGGLAGVRHRGRGNKQSVRRPVRGLSPSILHIHSLVQKRPGSLVPCEQDTCSRSLSVLECKTKR
jgi:hypothetical protein